MTPPPVRARVGGYVEFAPPPPLAGVIECAWAHTVAGDAALHEPPASHRVLPDDAASLAFTCRRDADGRAREPRLVLLGPVRTPRAYALEPGREMVAVKLRPEWVPALLDTAAADHADAIDDLPVGDGALERLAATRRWPDALAIVWALVRAGARRGAPRLASPDRAQRAVAALRCAPPPPHAPVAWAAARLGASPRQLRRLVHDAVGLSPIEVARTWRFLRALAVADRGAGAGWAAVAAHAGYADQAHLVREFRALAGVTPARLLDERRRESAACPAPR